MKLHYKKEHISCTNYKSESYEGFGIGTYNRQIKSGVFSKRLVQKNIIYMPEVNE